MSKIYQTNIYILKSISEIYVPNKIITIEIKKKIGQGNFGVVYSIGNNNVIKIFKNSIYENTLQGETSNIIPYTNENRELIFFNEIINQIDNKNYIIKVQAIGYITGTIRDKLYTFIPNSNFVILPLCYQFYNIYNYIKNDNYSFVIKIMQRLANICYHLEKTYKKIDLDLKLTNCVFQTEDGDINKMILLDFSLLKSIENNQLFNKKYFDNMNYYIWPIENNYNLSHIHSYSICINGLELIFGFKEIKDNLPNKNKILYFLNELKGSKIYEIFLKGLTEKIETNKLLELLNNFFV